MRFHVRVLVILVGGVLPLCCCCSGYSTVYYAWLTATPLDEIERSVAKTLHYIFLCVTAGIGLLWISALVMLNIYARRSDESPNADSLTREPFEDGGKA